MADPQLQALVERLQRRGRLLRPPDQLIRRALQKCVAYDRRSGRLDSLPAGEASRRLARLAGGSAEDPDPADDAKPVVGTDELPNAIPEEVAGAPTLPEESVPPPVRRQPRDDRRDAPALPPGSEMAGYRIEGVLGTGGMGQVYRAHQISMNRAVAFKVLAPRLGCNKRFRSRFIREARNAGRLQHPNLISVHDVGEAGAHLFFSMELVEGQSIGDILKRQGPFEEGRALAIGRQVLDALVYAHGNGVVHRDIKPDNIMLTAGGMVKVADLGLSRGLEEVVDGSTTQSGSMMGTPFYMPPEQGRDAHKADNRADIWALGATLYHMICGEVPFGGRTAVEVVLNASTNPVTFPDGVPSPPVRKFLLRLLSKKPDDRPQSAEEARDLLDRVMQTVTRHSTTDPLTGGRLRGQRRRRSARSAWLVSAISLPLLVLAGWYLVQYRERQQRWDTVTRTVEDAITESRYGDARDAIDAFIAAFPSGQGDAAPLRAEVVQEWNDRAQELVADDIAAIGQRLADRDYGAAGAIIDGVLADPLLASPAVQVNLAEERARLTEYERRDWEKARQRMTAAEQAGDLAAVREELRGFRPDSDTIREEILQWSDRLDLDLATAAAQDLPRDGDAGRWVQASIDQGGFAHVEPAARAGHYRLVERGSLQLVEGRGAPEIGRYSLRLRIDPAAMLAVGFGQRLESGGFIVRDGQVAVVEPAPFHFLRSGPTGRPGRGDRRDAATVIARLIDRGRIQVQERDRVEADLIIDVVVSASEITARLRHHDGRYQVQLPRPRHGTSCSLVWQADDKPITLMVQ